MCVHTVKLLLHYSLRGAAKRAHGPSLPAPSAQQADSGGKQGGIVKLLFKLAYAYFWALNNGIVSESFHYGQRA